MFSREDTKALKGIAVVMMLLHHLAGFSNRYPVGFEGFKSLWEGFITEGYLENLAANVRICVSVFFFLGGYGMYKRMESGKGSLLDSIIGLFKSYWKVFVIFVPIAFIFFRRSGDGICYLCTRYDVQDLKTIITVVTANFFAMSDSINSEWWFIQTYICAMFLGTIYCIVTKKNKYFVVELFIIFMIDVFIRSFFPALESLDEFNRLASNFFYDKLLTIENRTPCFFAGITFAKFDAVVKIKKKLSEIPCSTLVSFIAVFAVMWCRGFVLGELFDIVYVISFTVLVSKFFDGVKPVKKIFGYIGKHNTNIWLIHTFFCYYFLEVTKIVYCTRNVWVDLLILLAMSLVSSVIINFIFKKSADLLTLVKKKFPKKSTVK
ncbi:MAG: acyltransferase [Ruminococcus sp.]|nr:acyltransferase [Ruminococcus sp.]MDE6788705.1 acyltransferase [Ruminococcus sp.]